MIYVHNNTNFFTKLNTVLHTDKNDFETKLTTINQDYCSLKTEMNMKYESYKSKFATLRGNNNKGKKKMMMMKKKKQKKQSQLPLIASTHEIKPSDDNMTIIQKRSETIHDTLSPKIKTFISLFKNSITQNKKSINNYKQCIKEIEKEFYITGCNFNPKTDYRQGLPKRTKVSLLTSNNPNKEKQTETGDSNDNIASRITNVIQTRISMDQIEAIKLEELTLKINEKKEKINKRIKVLKNAIKYLQLNGIRLDKYLEKNPFPPKPFCLPYSEDFILAAKFNKTDIIEEALNRNVDYLFEYDYYGQTAFHWAAKMGYVKLLQLLLKKGRCCNQYDKKKRTPLYLAALNNHTECCLMLVNKNGSLDLCDNDGKRPCDVTTDLKLKAQLYDLMEKNAEKDKHRLINILNND